jgi:hypothetical protein
MCFQVFSFCWLVFGESNWFLAGRNRFRAPLLIEPAERSPYFIFFLGVALTAFGSGYYHANPGDAGLVWDRLPMTIGFMSLLADNRRTHQRKNRIAIARISAYFGVASVLYWNFTRAITAI